jgi:hypothetical protein
MKTRKLIFSGILVGAFLVLNVSGALAQKSSDHQMIHNGASKTDKTMHKMDKNGHGTHPKLHAARNGSGNPTLPGQDAFGAIQEIITILESDPATDWTKVDISALRSHLVDMNRLVMDTNVLEKNIDGGLEINITGQGSVLLTIQNMVSAHAPMIDGLNNWVAKAKVTHDGAKLTVMSADKKEVAHIRGLGFFGLMVSGSHHQTHHLGLARGEKVHMQ